MIEIRNAGERGVAEHGWLSSRHTFSFGHYRDPNQVGFSDLLVINDDRVMGGQGFDRHSHRDGALEHKDSMGTGAVIRPGDVQMMSAGTGVSHSEFNHSQTEQVHFLQIWIVPNVRGAAPRYQQVHFPEAGKRGRLQLIISPSGADGSLGVHQDAYVYAGLFDGGECDRLELGDDRYAYVHVARGKVLLNDIALSEGDGGRLRDESQVTISGGENAEILVFNLRPNEVPQM
jgi:quercetin 2,3-dioxygenase